ncbi:hypothetical protein HO419_07840 [Streptococcus suis]|uniref:Uncharacterized protein n=1 Tax=Streptococcus suis TaxID=1307 RepID=A0A9Q5C078_STRSU|nr:hypothetical protein [Streptococcus suis]MCK3847830.1 hypothetical protein [Streptococcus suis]MCK3958147.1 hypothetical protein [Streptococcus suis]MCK4064385.1 hypothetical protein [Streptococcus suis]NQJ60074.1 hypothetical protein [Streptococcus suis]NQJ63853.1 hypothetical protein [Streptococcus suis]
MNPIIFTLIVFIIAVGAYIFLKAQGNWKKALVELIRALAVIFGCIASIGEFFGGVFRRMSNGLKSFDEESNLEAIKEHENQKEALALAGRTIYSEFSALRNHDKLAEELLHNFFFDTLSGSYKIVFTRFMEISEKEKILSKLKEVANSAIADNMYYVAEITSPQLSNGTGGYYISKVIFDLKSNNEQRERRLAQHTEREHSEVDSVESVID